MNVCYSRTHKRHGIIFKSKDNFYNLVTFSGDLISYSKEHFYNLQNYIKQESLSYEYLIYTLVCSKYYQQSFFKDSLRQLNTCMISLLQPLLKIPIEIINIIFDFF